MEQRRDETLVEYAQRCVDEGRPEQSVSWEQTIDAAWLVRLAATFPEGTSPQSMVRGMATMRLSDQLATEAACREDVDDISATLHAIADGVEQIASTKD
ncbi:hypothetical protein Hbl1158_17005 (plasmid) [Halobaculum sp. CBA1158]|uniref:hypothetical protein n=1 Tax=Halobaculum sp. CBA1158 TaxID=2904243 RepID=UPI001F395B4C|nr:hypothetical protein [Halobaculum sp. CBA1158]UIP01702.1 hypothetical protein Hbl1158_17005 [Halobaculum sp. CBA1158]